VFYDVTVEFRNQNTVLSLQDLNHLSTLQKDSLVNFPILLYVFIRQNQSLGEFKIDVRSCLRSIKIVPMSMCNPVRAIIPNNRLPFHPVENLQLNDETANHTFGSFVIMPFTRIFP
jgi:hypothetical protein